MTQKLRIYTQYIPSQCLDRQVHKDGFHVFGSSIFNGPSDTQQIFHSLNFRVELDELRVPLPKSGHTESSKSESKIGRWIESKLEHPKSSGVQNVFWNGLR